MTKLLLSIKNGLDFLRKPAFPFSIKKLILRPKQGIFRKLYSMIKTHKLNLFFLLLLAGHLPFTSSAQQTIPHISPYQHFQQGLDQLDKNRYGNAYQAFNHYLKNAESPILEASARYYRAYAAMELFHDDTESYLREFLNDYPFHNKTPLAKYQLGKYHFRNDNFQEALPWLTSSDPNFLDDENWAEWHFMSGYAWLDQGEYDEAEKLFSRIKDYSNPFNEDANYFYGYISMQKGNYLEAVNHFSKVDATSQFDNIIPVYNTQALVNLERYDEAIAYAERRLADREPDKKHLIHRALGKAFYFRDNLTETINNYEEYLEVEDELSDEENYYLGFAYLSEGKPAKAVDRMEGINIPENEQGQKMAYHFGQALQQEGDLLKAKNSFELAQNMDYDQQIQKEAAYNSAVLAYDLDFQTEAIERFQEFAEEYPGTELGNNAQGYLGEILLATQNYQQALDIIENLPERSPEIERSYQQIAYFYALNNHKDGSHGRAKEYFTKASEIDVDAATTAKARFWLGEINYIQGNYNEANSHYWAYSQHPAVDQTPYSDLIHYNLGYSFFQQEEYSNAISRFTRFLDHSDAPSRHPEKAADALLRLADSRFGIREFQAAYNGYEQYTDQYQDNADYAFFQMATIAGLQGRYNTKLGHLSTIRDDFPRSRYLEDAIFEIGDVQFIQRNYDAALNSFNYLKQEFPESPYTRSATLKIGMIHYNQGNDQRAQGLLMELAEEAPHSQEASEALNVLRNIFIEAGQEDELFAFIEDLPGLDLRASMEDSITYESALNNWHERNWEGAYRSFGNYLEEFPEGFFRLRAHHYRGESAWRINERQTAVEHFDEVLEMRPNQFVENAARRKSDYKMAIEDYQKAYEAFRIYESEASDLEDRLKALEGLMVSSYELEEYRTSIARAEDILQMADAGEDDKVAAHYYAGKSHYHTGNHDQARASFKHVYEAGRSERGAESLFLTAQILLEEGAAEEAKEKIYRLRENFRIYDHYVARGFVLLGEVFHQQGDDHQARHTLESVIKNHSDEEIIKEAEEKLASIEKRLEEQEDVSPEPDEEEMDEKDEFPEENEENND